MAVLAGVFGLPLTGSGAVPGTYSGDQQIANAVFGSVASAGAIPPPAANHFGFPIAIGMGARSLGMGEAFTALSDDLSAVWWNPAGLVQMEKNEIHWMGGDRLSDLPYTGFFSASYMLQNRMNFALSYMRPYHPIGYYPDVVAGSYTGAQSYSGGSSTVDVLGGSPGSKVNFFDVPDPSVQEYLKGIYRKYIQLPFQEDTLAFTYAAPLSSDNNLSMGINVKYYFNDALYAADHQVLENVAGYGVDLGLFYRYPMPEMGREFSAGLNLRDVASQVRFSSAGSSDTTSGREVTLPTIATLGLAWKTREFFSRQDLNLSADLIYINDPSFDDNANRRMNLGAEMWFRGQQVGVRGGYSLFYNRQLSRPTLGLSWRSAQKPSDDGFALDYAFQFPSENEDSAMHWFSLSYKWGGLVKAPSMPEVHVEANPPIFFRAAPGAEEQDYPSFTTFHLSAESPKGIERWTLIIQDAKGQVVRAYQDRGNPPAHIVWAGDDRYYRPLPKGQYFFSLSATDHDKDTNPGSAQSLTIELPVTPTPTPPIDKQAAGKLAERVKTDDQEMRAKDEAVRAAVQKELEEVLRKLNENQVLPPTPTPLATPEAQPLSPSAEAKAPDPYSFPFTGGPTPPKVERVGAKGKETMRIQYTTQQGLPKSIVAEMMELLDTAVGIAGMQVQRYAVEADYGGHKFKLETPTVAALELKNRFITPRQFLAYRPVKVTMDGQAIQPD